MNGRVSKLLRKRALELAVEIGSSKERVGSTLMYKVNSPVAIYRQLKRKWMAIPRNLRRVEYLGESNEKV